MTKDYRVGEVIEFQGGAVIHLVDPTMIGEPAEFNRSHTRRPRVAHPGTGYQCDLRRFGGRNMEHRSSMNYRDHRRRAP